MMSDKTPEQIAETPRIPTPRADECALNMPPGDALSAIIQALQLARDLERELTLALAEKEKAERERDDALEKVRQLRIISNVNGDWNIKYLHMSQRADLAERSLEAAKRETIEECARLCDVYEAGVEHIGGKIVAAQLGKRIRALSPSPQEHNKPLDIPRFLRKNDD